MSTTSPTAASSTSGVVPTAATNGAGALATYSRTGGLAGKRFDVVVRPDGTFEGGTGKPAQARLGASGLDALRTLVAAFAAAAPQPRYGDPVADGLVSSVAAGGASTTVESGAPAPPAVQQLISFMAALERQLPR